MTATADDYRYMARALQLAQRGLYTTDPNPNVGCVLVADDGTVVGEGYHQRAGQPHAEPLAIAAAGDRARGTTAYVTLEPCNHHGRTPPCSEALIAAGVRRVVAATTDPNPTVSGRGYAKLRAAGIAVTTGVMEADAIELNRGYTQRMRTGRPWVRTKLAVSIDGKTALANGESQWITGSDARADVHRWRARSSVVLSGSGTVLADNPSLTARIPELPEDAIVQPHRVVVDSQLRVPADARLFTAGSGVVLAHCGGDAAASARLRSAGAELLKTGATQSGRVALDELLTMLAERGSNDVWVEAGAHLNGALLEAGCIDELIVYQAACVLGDSAQGMFATSPLQSMAERYNLVLTDVRRCGADVRFNYIFNPKV